jgi:hypothetical protein
MVSLQAVMAYQGITAYELKLGCYCKEDIMNFMWNSIRNIKKEGKGVLVMDNGMLKYKGEISQTLVKMSCGLQVVYLPPASPLISPLENLFRKLKNATMVKKFVNAAQLHEYLQGEMKKLKMMAMKRFFDEADVYIKQGIKKIQM